MEGCARQAIILTDKCASGLVGQMYRYRSEGVLVLVGSHSLRHNAGEGAANGVQIEEFVNTGFCAKKSVVIWLYV